MPARRKATAPSSRKSRARPDNFTATFRCVFHDLSLSIIVNKARKFHTSANAFIPEAKSCTVVPRFCQIVTRLSDEDAVS